MTTGSIAEDLDVVEDIGTGEIAGFINGLADTFLLQAAEEGPTMALSQQLPRRLILGCRLCSRQKRRQSSLPNCVPWSE